MMTPAATRHTTTAALKPLEIATNLVVGRGEQLERDVEPRTAFAALAEAIRPALQRGRCLVSFSGGHDSTLVLAAAAHVARTDGLPLPIPITWRFSNAPRADESAMQAAMITELKLPDWIVLQAGNDLDLVGPVAQQVLRRYGPVFPANAYIHAPLYAHAAGGTLLDGLGGDQVFGRFHRPRRPWPVASSAGRFDGAAWLRPRAARAARRIQARERRRAPRDPAARPRWRAEARDLLLTRHTADELAGAADARAEHPLLSPTLVAAIERTGLSPHSTGGRAGLLSALFGGELPHPCLARRPKAVFNEVIWRKHTEEHVRSWDGRGVDGHVVDAHALSRLWRNGWSGFQTALLIQQTWLATHELATHEDDAPTARVAP